MAFSSAYTTQETKRINLAQVFVRAGNAKLTDIECDAIVTGKTIPTSGGWVRLQTVDGGVSLTMARTTTPLQSQQDGISDQVINEEPLNITMNLAAVGIQDLAYLLQENPGNDPATNTIAIREQRGISLKANGFSLLVYPKNDDPTNTSNTPAFTNSTNTLVLFNVVNIGDIPMLYDNAQNSATLTLSALSSESSGSAKGHYGMFGKFTVLGA